MTDKISRRIMFGMFALLLLAGSAAAYTKSDFDGDGKSDYSVFRPSTGTFFYIASSTGTFNAVGWGQACDRVIDGDFDGDGRADIAIWRPATGDWWVRPSLTPTVPLVRNWGSNSFGDIPVPGDYDGDTKTDMGIYRPGSPATWWILKSSPGNFVSSQVQSFGTAGDIPTEAVYKDCGCP